MKKLLYAAALIVLAGCTSDNTNESEQVLTTADKVAIVMEMEPDPAFDTSNSGLFKGIIASYDLKTKGTLAINTTEKGGYLAAAKFHKVTDGMESVVLFEGNQDSSDPDRLYFTSERGSFEVLLNDEKRLVVEHFEFDETDAYLVAYKRSRGTDVSLAMGTFDDDYGTPGGFEGNWDAIHRGSIYTSPAGEHSTFATNLLMVDEIVISQGGNMYINQDGIQNDDPFDEPCFYEASPGVPENFPHVWFYDTSGYREFIGYNQTTTFASRVATWSLAYYFFGGEFIYDTPTCGTSAAAGFGTFSWDGNNGQLRVDTLTDL
ncbi:hypothetical protein [Gilvibacter sp.]|uniref:hypothetical protein n=1 Tax=Gilvibacter sp. TaxID=2729997 RepID=UPI0025C4720A|nr:hypothetical protein [Gilvibacter sp.]NQX76450.1 hypothetical protein [Gilvibacter sp.]